MSGANDLSSGQMDSLDSVVTKRVDRAIVCCARVRLPPDAEAGTVDAQLKDGVLTITVPKTAPKKSQTGKVEIRKG